MIHLIVVLIVLGLLLWLADQLPIDGLFKTIIRMLVILCAILYILQMLGAVSYPIGF